MKKLLTVLLISVFAMGCSKDDNKKPDDALLGNWKGLKMEVLYQKADGSKYRDDVITEDVINNEPNFTLIMKEKTLTIVNDDGTEQEISYTRKGNILAFTLDGKKQEVVYSISGKKLVVTHTERNAKVQNDIIIPKMLIVVHLEKLSGMQPQ